jgi:nucleotide-binding universal stress UspA family protein
MERQILVPLDGAELAEAIVPHAERLARATGSGLTLLRAIPPPWIADPLAGAIPPFTEAYETWESELGWADEALTEVARRVRTDGLAAQTEVIEGDPATVIVTYAARHLAIQAIALATHGRTGLRRLVVGSVAETVLRSAPKPVLLIRPLETREALIAPPARPYQTIVVPLDGSALAARALEEAQPLAAASGATIVLVTAVPGPAGGAPWHVDPQARGEHLPDYLVAARQQVAAAGIPVQLYLSPTPAAAAIMDVSDQVEADLIVMSTHGRGGWQRIRLGSVAWDIVQMAQRPVLLISPAARATALAALQEPVASTNTRR